MTRIAFVLALISSPAIAQQPAAPPPPVDIVLTVDEQKALQTFLADQPFKISAPIIQLMMQKQEEARKPPVQPAAPPHSPTE